MIFFKYDRWTKKYSIDWSEVFVWLLTGLIVTFFIYLFYMMGLSMRIDALCLENNFPESKTTWNMVGYCIKTVEQTQYVVPLSEILK